MKRIMRLISPDGTMPASTTRLWEFKQEKFLISDVTSDNASFLKRISDLGMCGWQLVNTIKFGLVVYAYFQREYVDDYVEQASAGQYFKGIHNSEIEPIGHLGIHEVKE